MWNAETDDAVLKLEGHTDIVTSVAFSPDGKRIASGSHDRTILVWDAETGEALLKPLKGHANIITSVAFSLDGKRIVSGSHDQTIRIWDTLTGDAVLKPL
jgi:WD40 repeat protein